MATKTKRRATKRKRKLAGTRAKLTRRSRAKIHPRVSNLRRVANRSVDTGRAVEFCVNTGHPSWHQSRAGHASAGAMCFNNGGDAQRYMARFKRRTPGEPAFITRRRRGGWLAKPRLSNALT